MKTFGLSMSEEMKRRLHHHGKRLGKSLSDLVRDACAFYLEELDEAELRGATVRRRVQVLESRMQRKFDRSFRRFAEYVEGATDAVDRAERMATVREDVESRASTPEEASQVLEAFNQFLSGRTEATTGAKFSRYY